MKKTRILVVDDEPSLTRQLKRQLEGTERFEVWTESSGRGALAAAGQFRPEVVLLDVMMPDMDGGEVKFRLEQVPELADTVFIYLTALYNGDHNDKGIFLAKPAELERIMECIDRHLGRRRPAQLNA